METIRSTGSHQVISAPTSQFRACLTDGIVAKLGNKGADLWVYLADASGRLVFDCNVRYFEFHFEYVKDEPKRKASSAQEFKRWFEAQAGRPPVSLEEQAELKNTLIPELKQKLRIAEQRLQNATSYAVARLWARKAWEMKHDQE